MPRMKLRLIAILTTFTAVFTLGSQAAVPAASPEMAIQAEQMLSANWWAEAIAIENTNKTSRYPETVYATVFEFDNSLWFYTATGTQPLVASKGRAEQYKNDLLPLLRTIDRGFVSFEFLNPSTDESSALTALPNGCVVESIYSFGSVQQNGTPILAAKLLLYSSSKNSRRGAQGNAVGHCVLIYETPQGMFFVDPPEIGVSGEIRKTRDWDPVQLAHEIESPYGKINIDEAFFVPFSSQPVLVAN